MNTHLPGQSSYQTDFVAHKVCPVHGPRGGQHQPRPHIPFEGRTTAQDAYVPKVLEDGPTFGTRRETGDGAAPYQRPYIPFEVCVLGVGVCGCVYGERECVRERVCGAFGVMK